MASVRSWPTIGSILVSDEGVRFQVISMDMHSSHGEQTQIEFNCIQAPPSVPGFPDPFDPIKPSLPGPTPFQWIGDEVTLPKAIVTSMLKTLGGAYSVPKSDLTQFDDAVLELEDIPAIEAKILRLK